MLAQISPTPFINPTSIVTLFPAARFTDVSTLVNIIAPLATIGASLLLGGMLARAAFLVLTAGAEAEKMEEAKKTATFAVIGIIIIISAFLIVKLIGFIFKIEIPL